MMKIRYWGTAAAEGIPSLFCGCAVCKEAREKKGRYIRTRSQLVVDDSILIDLNADTYSNAMRFDFDMSKLEHLLITHVHADHYYPKELANRGINYSKDLPHETLTVYGSQDIVDAAKDVMYLVGQKRLAFCPLTPYQPFTIGGIMVTPLPAVHDTPNPYIYILQKEGKTFFLCNDTGILEEETFAWLKENNVRFDCISYDCTFGEKDASYGGTYKPRHLGFPQIEQMRAILKANGNLTAETKEIITHFSHNVETIGYGNMDKLSQEKGFILAYDGLEIDI